MLRNFFLFIALSSTLAFFSPTAQAQPATLSLDSTVLNVSTLITGLDVPWEILWGPDNYIWMTERGGTVSRVNPETGAKTPILEITDCAEVQETGLLGMVLHPQFDTNPYVYLVYTYWGTTGNITERLVRYTYNGTELIDSLILLDNIPGTYTHAGSRLIITPDLKLIMTTGDAQNQPAAQSFTQLIGKFLRLNLDGSIPEDNPSPTSLIYSYGHRNAQGVVLAPNGIMYSSEHGPTNDDEFNIITPNRNYGWPDVHGFCNLPSEITFCNNNNVVEPLVAWTPTLAVAGIDYYDHPAIPEWRNTVLLCAMKAQRLVRLSLSADGLQVTNQTNYFNNQVGRIRDICISPTGDVYISTTNEDAYGDGTPDRIIKIHNPNYQMPIAEAAFEANDSCLVVNFSNNSLNADTYLWNFGNNVTSSEPNPTHIYAAEGTYTVQLIASNGNSSDTTTLSLTIDDCISRVPSVLEQAINIYPNPAVKYIQIDFPSELQGGTLQICPINGQKVYEQILPTQQKTLTVHTEHLPRNTYIATLKKGNISISKTITLQ